MDLAGTVAAVHTTGVNWESVVTIIAGIVVIVGAFIGWIGTSIKSSINNLSTTLEAKLETKDNVRALTTRIAVIETELMHRDSNPNDG